MPLAIKVPVIESERGWGSKVDDYIVCLSVEDAKSFVVEFNSSNPPGPAPDWYMQATDKFIPFDISEEQYKALKALKKSGKSRMWLSSLRKI